jgi:hypothetical protein
MTNHASGPNIVIASDGKHSYDFEYTLKQAERQADQ